MGSATSETDIFASSTCNFNINTLVIASSGGPVVRDESEIVTDQVGERLRTCTSLYRS